MRAVRNTGLKAGSVKSRLRAGGTRPDALSTNKKMAVPSLKKAASGGSSHPVAGRVKEARGASHINPPRETRNLSGYVSQGQPFGRSAVGTKGSPKRILKAPRETSRENSVQTGPGLSGNYRKGGGSQPQLAPPRRSSGAKKVGFKPYSLNANRLGRGLSKGASGSMARKSGGSAAYRRDS